MRPIFGYNNFLDLATTSLAGGDWQSALPLTNLQDPRRGYVARSVTDASNDTRFYADLAAARLVRAISVHSHNLSLAATIRFRGWSSAPFGGTVVYDSAAFNPFENIFPSGVLEAGHPSYSSLDLSQEDYDAGYPLDIVHVLATPTSARYWSVEIVDTTNPLGYVEIGRVFLTYGYRPSHNISTGARFGWQTSSSRIETEGGASFHEERVRRRQFDFTLEQFADDEALVYLNEFERRVGTHEQFLFVGNESDTAHMHRRSFLATLEKLNPLALSKSLYSDHAFSLIEEL